MRLLAFVLALLLLAGNVAPERGWLITLVVLTGLAAVRPRFWSPFDVRPRLDARLAAFLLATLLLAGAIEPTRDWLIALAAVTGVAAFMPRAFALDRLLGFDHGWHRHRGHGRWDTDDDRRWARWERRMERRWRRIDPFGDDWP